jgi:hypothetical protein
VAQLCRTDRRVPLDKGKHSEGGEGGFSGLNARLGFIAALAFLIIVFIPIAVSKG